MYTRTLEDYLLYFAADVHSFLWEFQQDHASITSDKLTKGCLKEKNIKLMLWHSRSPDLNPVENVWGLLSHNVNTNGWQFKDMMENNILAKKIAPNYLHKLLQSMPNRIKQALKRRLGNFTSLITKNDY